MIWIIYNFLFPFGFLLFLPYFILRMSREEIGSFLGLKLETVSRTLSKFQSQGWITVEHKHIQLIQPERLKDLVGGCLPATQPPQS